MYSNSNSYSLPPPPPKIGEGVVSSLEVAGQQGVVKAIS